MTVTNVLGLFSEREFYRFILVLLYRSDRDRAPLPAVAAAADPSSRGILGGEASTRATIAAATKEDELINAALRHPPKREKKAFAAPKKPPASKASSSRGDARPRSRSRSPVFRRTARDRDNRGSEQQNKKGDRRGSGGGRGRGKEKEKDRKEKKRNREYLFYTPESFEQAWSSSFFSPTLLLLITALGFVIKRIPWLNKLPIGGRLRHCSESWKVVSNSNWVNNVVSEGYRIPFKYVPRMKFPPSNPVAHGPAYDVLVSEAEALQQKNAIFPVEPCEGHYISSYFAVPKPCSEKF